MIAINRKLVLSASILLFILSHSLSLLGQGFPNEPKTILKQWDYYKMIELLGEGEPIIDTLRGQAYIAGMAYKETWLNRTADVSYFFKDIDIASFKLKYWSPYIAERNDGRLTNVTDPAIRDSLLREFQIQDSLRVDSVNKLLLVDSLIIKKMDAKAIIINAEKQILYDLDSLRCDSLISDISVIMGPPLRKGMTHHTDREARYFAVWVKKGIAISLRDFTDYTDIAFSIPFVNSVTALAFDLDPASEILSKSFIPVRRDTLGVSLLGVSVNNDLDLFNKVGLLVESKTGSVFVEKFHYDLSLRRTNIEFLDFNNDGIQEVWIKGNIDSTETCQVHHIYTLETIEPIIIFDSKLETDEGLSIQLMHGHQARITLADGTAFLFPIKTTNKAIQGYYDSEGVLLHNEFIIPGCLKYLENKASDKNTQILEGRISLFTETKNLHLCDLVITWDLIRGIWEVIDYHVIAPE